MVTLANPFETDAPSTRFSRHDSRRIAKSAHRFRGALTYDMKGNLVTRPASLQSPALSLVWDFDNKLRGADTNGTPATLEVTYEYDALGRRVARSGPSGNVVYFQAGQQTIADYPRSGVPASATYRYVYGAYIDEPLLRETVSGSVRHFFHRNQQYSITALTDSAGNTAERYAYTAYGVLTVFNSSGIPQATSPLNNRYTYTGREWDDSTKLYHFRARWYDPAAGSFVGRDPLGFIDGYSVYSSYFSLSTFDPLGTGVCGGCRDAFFNMIEEQIVEFIMWKIAEITGQRVAKIALKLGVTCVVDGPLPIGDIVGAIWTAYDLASLGIELS